MTPRQSAGTMRRMETDTSIPRAPREDHWLEAHGHRRNDPWYWLKDDQRSRPEVIDYLEAENRYTAAILNPVAELEQSLFQEMVSRIQPDDASVPLLIDDYWYYTRFEPEREYPIIARRQGTLSAAEEILLDVNQLAEGKEYFDLANSQVSDDHRFLAYAEDEVGRRLFTTRIKDLQTGETLPETIEATSGALAWAADNRTLFYVRKHPDTLLPYQVLRHRLGTPTEQDELVYQESDQRYYTSVYRGKSRDYIYIHLGSTLSDEVHLLPAGEPDSAFRVFYPREREHEYSVTDRNGRFFVLSNWQAVNFRVLETGLEDAGQRERWQELVPHRPDALIEAIDPFRDFLVLNERSDGLSRLRVLPDDGGESFLVAADEPAYSMCLDDNVDVTSNVLRYGYTSMTTPYTVYDLDLDSGERTFKKQAPVPGVDPALYRTERLALEARDGAMIPVSLVYHKDYNRDASRPILVYGYGAYGISMDPAFSPGRVSLLDRGWVFAIAHIRGGQEMGRRWYDQGRLQHKANSFNDFIDVTRELVSRRYADPKRVYAMGGSAGGLLMGAVMNQAPDLFRGVVAQVPFVDVVTSMLDEDIPLTTGEYDEWGDPRKEADYRNMLSYSPYDQVSAQDYPNLLVTSGLHDSQVQYWEPTKWVARLRELKTDENLLLLHTDMDAGHSGASGRFKQYRDVAREYAFLLLVDES